ncbi:MAG: aminotransferase class III-fold pyridoxal phosphate-dependent enzyme [Collinsella sp.]
MKLARLYAKRAGNGGNTIVCMRGGFHGRTLETIAATMQDWLQDSFRPLPGGFVACTPNDVDELRAIFKQLGSEICAVMLEPIRVRGCAPHDRGVYGGSARPGTRSGRRPYRRRGPVRSVPLR